MLLEFVHGVKEWCLHGYKLQACFRRIHTEKREPHLLLRPGYPAEKAEVGLLMRRRVPSLENEWSNWFGLLEE